MYVVPCVAWKFQLSVSDRVVFVPRSVWPIVNGVELAKPELTSTSLLLVPPPIGSL